MSRSTRDELLELVRESLPQIEAGRLLREAARGEELRAELAAARHVVAVAAGKAAVPMLRAFLADYGELVGDALAIVPEHGGLEGARCIRSTHPLPSSSSVCAAQAVRELLAGARSADDVVVLLLSGGASAMLAEPLEPLTLDDFVEITGRLLLSGLDVTTINVVRRSLTTLHGGRFAELASPARVRTFVLCDNVEVGAPAVGSGPTFPWTPPRARVLDIVRGPGAAREDLAERVAAAMRADPFPDRRAATARNVVICDPRAAAAALRDAAAARGYAAVVLPELVTGEARVTAARLADRVRSAASGRPRPLCVTAAGEVTVRVNGSGVGGRCQELAWSMLPHLEASLPNATFAAVATDGCDFVPGVAGAVVDREIAQQARTLCDDWSAVLDANDTGSALRALGVTIDGWAASTNLCDLYLFLVKE